MHRKRAGLRLRLNAGGHAMGRKHRDRAIGDLVQFFDKYRASFAQFAHHMLVVHNFVANIHRGALLFQRALHNGDGPFYAGTKAARGGQHNVQGRMNMRKV